MTARPWDPAMLNKLVPSHSPEVANAKLQRLEERRAKDFDKFLRSLEGSK